MMLIVGREPDDAYKRICLCVLAYSTEFKAVSHAPNRVITEKLTFAKSTRTWGRETRQEDVEWWNTRKIRIFSLFLFIFFYEVVEFFLSFFLSFSRLLATAVSNTIDLFGLAMDR